MSSVPHDKVEQGFYSLWLKGRLLIPVCGRDAACDDVLSPSIPVNIAGWPSPNDEDDDWAYKAGGIKITAFYDRKAGL